MPRTWGYIIIAAAALIGVGALVMPIPEGVEIEPMAVPTAKKVEKPVPAPAPQPRNAARPKPTPKPPVPPPAKVIPRDDTTKARTVIQPNKS